MRDPYRTNSRWRGWAFGLSAVAVVMVGAVWMFSGDDVDRSPRRIAVLEKRLNNTDAKIRLQAASELLEIEPRRQDAVLVRAEALLTLGLPAEADTALDPLRIGGEGAMPPQALSILARSYTQRARDEIERGSRLTVDITQSNVEQLLGEARRTVTELSALKDQKAEALRLKAESLDVEAALYHMRRRRHPSAVALMKPDEESDERQLALEQVGLQTIGHEAMEIRRKLEQAERSLTQVCRQALALEPNHPQPRELLLRSALRQGDFKRVRALAREMAGLGRLTRSQAGRVALLLLDLDHQYNQYSSVDDVALAHRLLNHPKLVGSGHTDFHTAEVYLAYREGRYKDADALGRRYAKEDANPRRLARLLARVWTALGDRERAIRAITHFDPAFDTPQFNYEMGMTLLAGGDHARARDHLRRCLEMQPDYLPARIAIAQSLVEDGFIFEAERDIAAAIEINPVHPGVVELQCRLLVEKTDQQGLMALLDRAYPGAPGALEVALAAEMALDDTMAVQRLLETRRAGGHADVLTFVGRAWLATGALRRPEVAMTLVRAWRQRLRPDPMTASGPPVSSASLRERMSPDAVRSHREAPVAPKGMVARFALLASCRYVARLHEQAYEMVRRALEVGVGDQSLLMGRAVELSVWLGRHDSWMTTALSMGADSSQDPLAEAAAAYARDDLETVSRRLDRLATADRQQRPTAQWLDLALALRRGEEQAAHEHLEVLLEKRPREDLAVLMALSDAWVRGRQDQVEAWIELAERHNPMSARLAEASWELAHGRAMQALMHAQLADRRQDSGSNLARRAADLIARGYLMTGQINRAVGVLDSVALAAPRQRLELKLAASELLMDAGDAGRASAVLADALKDASIPAADQDELLSRAVVVMPANQLLNIVDSLLQFSEDAPVLLFYKARVLADEGRYDSARLILSKLGSRFPKSPRVWLLAASVEASAGRADSAKRFYGRVLEMGGAAAAAARRAMGTDELTVSGDEGSTPGVITDHKDGVEP